MEYKYKKYKNKYRDIKSQIGGATNQPLQLISEEENKAKN